MWIFGFVGWDPIADGPIAGEPASAQGVPAPLQVKWTNDTSMAVTSEPGVWKRNEMSIYVGQLEMFAGENKTIESSPPADQIDDAPDISGWELAATFTWTDGSGSFEKDYTAFSINSPYWTLTIDPDDTDGKAGKRAKFTTRRVDDGSNTELNWGFINVLA